MERGTIKTKSMLLVRSLQDSFQSTVLILACLQYAENSPSCMQHLLVRRPKRCKVLISKDEVDLEDSVHVPLENRGEGYGFRGTEHCQSYAA